MYRAQGMSSPPSAAAEFDALIREHLPALFRQAYRWTGTADRAQDLVQELLVRLYPELPILRTLDRVRPWALRVMYRLFVDQIRRERRSPVTYVGAAGALAADDDFAEAADETLEPSRLADSLLTQERIVAAFGALSADHRVVLSLHDIEGYSLEEVGEALGIPLGTAKSRLNRARARLREELLAGTESAAATCNSTETPREDERD